MARTPPLPGRSPGESRAQVLGDFELLERIGQGSMGAVFKARQRSMDRIVAVKVLRPSLAHDETYVTRFERETRAAARLSHPNIVLAIDAGERDGCRYFAMEYVEGHTVGLLLKAGPLEERSALAITVQVARALDYAWTHERIVHRDIKPGNIIITADGTAKLADLGLAHDADLGDEESFSKGGRILGTPFYISPEQIRHATDLDVRSDLYGLGATLYHMVTGQAPYVGGDTRAVLSRHLHDPPPDPRKVCPEVSAALARIIMRCMATKREDRYPNAAALVADIEALLGPGTTQETQLPRLHRVHHRRRSASPGPVLALCLALVAFAVLAVALVNRDNAPPAQPKKKEAPVRHPEAERAFGDALAFVKANPRKLAAAIERFEQVEREHAQTPFAAQAAEQRGKLATQLQLRATSALTALRSRADVYTDMGRYADAMALFATFPEELATEDWRRRVEAEREIVGRRARQAFERALAVAGSKPSLEQRLQALEAIEGPLPAAWQAERDERVAKVRAERADLVASQRQKHMTMLLRVYGQLRPLYGTRAYRRVEAAIQGALESMPESLHPDLKAELRELQALEDVWRTAEKGATALVGQPYTVRGIQGALVRVAAGQLTIETPGGTFTEDIHKLALQQVIGLVRSVLPARDADVAALRLRMAEGDAEGAETLIRKLEGEGEDVSALRERLRRLSESPKPDEPGVKKPDEPVPDVTPARQGLSANLQVGCDGTCEVLLNGSPVALSAAEAGSFATAEVEVAEGDLIAVAARGTSITRALYVRLATRDGQHALASDRSWLWSREAVAGWDSQPAVAGTWLPAEPAYWPQAKPGYEESGGQLPGCWVWGTGETCFFRKIVRFGPSLPSQRAEKDQEESSLDARYGKSRRASLRLACQGGYRLYHNERLIGCARTPTPRGATYTMRVRHGDVLGVEAESDETVPWLGASLDVEGMDEPIVSDRSWVWSSDAPEGWAARAAPRGRWATSTGVDAGRTIWGQGRRVLIRKTLDLEGRDPADSRRLHGRIRSISGGRVSVYYPFELPDELADWQSDGDWVWAAGRAVGTRGTLTTGPYDTEKITVHATVEAPGGVVLGLWGSEADRLAGYTLTLASTRQGTAVLRRGTRLIKSARLPGGKVQRQIVLRKNGENLVVEVDGEKIIDEEERQSLPASGLWRVGVRTGGTGMTVLSDFRVTGRMLRTLPDAVRPRP